MGERVDKLIDVLIKKGVISAKDMNMDAGEPEPAPEKTKKQSKKD